LRPQANRGLPRSPSAPPAAPPLLPRRNPVGDACPRRPVLFPVMNTARIERTLSILTPEEMRDALLFIDLCENKTMNTLEADEWRRRIQARRAFLDLQPSENHRGKGCVRVQPGGTRPVPRRTD
jgi:hypothetical protein